MHAALTFILIVMSPFSSAIFSPIASTAFSIRSIASALSVLVVVMTYSGGATNRTLMGTSSVESASPALSARRTASIPA
jgi:methyl coenzyme M reductase subunit C